MNTTAIEAYSYYKQQYPGAVILFKLESGLTQVSECGALSTVEESEYEEMVNQGLEVQAITYRNDEGKLDFPDISRLEAEKALDY